MSDCQLRARKKPKKARIESCGDESDRAGLENAQMGTARSGAGYSRTKKSESLPRAPSARRTHGSIRAFLSFFRARSWQSLPCAGTLLYCLLRSRKRPKKARIESCGAESNRAGLKSAQIRTTRSGAGYSRIKKSGSLPRAPSPRRIHGSIRAFFGFFRARSWQSLPCAERRYSTSWTAATRVTVRVGTTVPGSAFVSAAVSANSGRIPKSVDPDPLIPAMGAPIARSCAMIAVISG